MVDILYLFLSILNCIGLILSFSRIVADTRITSPLHCHAGKTTKPDLGKQQQHLVPNYSVNIWQCQRKQATGSHKNTSIPFKEMADNPPGRRFYTMYHGTTVNAAYNIINNGFAVSNDGMLGRGVYASRDMEKASRYPLNEVDSKVVLKLSVRVGKVKKIDSQQHPMRLTWHDHGYDTAWVPPECGMVWSGLQENCIYEPWRIKVVDVVSGPALHLNSLKSLIAAKN